MIRRKFGGLPAGDYVITLEAADYHGNVADMITINVTIEGGADESGTDTATGGATMTGPSTMTGASMTGFLEDGGETTADDDGTGGGSTTSSEDDSSGCSCTSSPGAGGALMLVLGLLGFAATRRRDD